MPLPKNSRLHCSEFTLAAQIGDLSWIGYGAAERAAVSSDISPEPRALACAGTQISAQHPRVSNIRAGQSPRLRASTAEASGSEAAP